MNTSKESATPYNTARRCLPEEVPLLRFLFCNLLYPSLISSSPGTSSKSVLRLTIPLERSSYRQTTNSPSHWRRSHEQTQGTVNITCSLFLNSVLWLDSHCYKWRPKQINYNSTHCECAPLKGPVTDHFGISALQMSLPPSLRMGSQSVPVVRKMQIFWSLSSEFSQFYFFEPIMTIRKGFSVGPGEYFKGTSQGISGVPAYVFWWRTSKS